jgi:hypothetical protein
MSGWAESLLPQCNHTVRGALTKGLAASISSPMDRRFFTAPAFTTTVRT